MLKSFNFINMGQTPLSYSNRWLPIIAGYQLAIRWEMREELEKKGDRKSSQNT